MNPHTFMRVDFPRSLTLSRRTLVAAAALAGAWAVAGCKNTPVTPAAQSYITADTQRAESEASSFRVSFQLDRTRYDAGDEMQFRLAIHNLNGVHQSLGCGYTTTQRYDFIVRDSTAHTQVWRFAQDRTFDEVGGVQFDPAGGIADGDSVVYDETWTLAGQQGEALAAGHLFSITAFPLCVGSRITPPTITFRTRSGA